MYIEKALKTNISVNKKRKFFFKISLLCLFWCCNNKEILKQINHCQIKTKKIFYTNVINIILKGSFALQINFVAEAYFDFKEPQGCTAHHITNKGASYCNIYVCRYPILNDTVILSSV
jgi:hypothetical protein